MHPFEFIILFFSFIYTLALTHILFAATRMIRHRRQLVFSWPHALWMVATLQILAGNWLSQWDFHEAREVNLTTFLGGFAMVVVQYFVCALVSPDFEDGETYDLRAFHDRERRTYIGAFIVLCLLSLALNFSAGAGLGVQNWAKQNLLVLTMLVLLVPPLLTANRWVQIVCPVGMVCLGVAYPLLYYPVLK